MSVLLCLFGWWWRICGGWFIFRYTTFFNIYYVNLNIVRNNWLTVVGRQQPRFASLMAKLWDQGSKFPCKESIGFFYFWYYKKYFSLFVLSVQNFRYWVKYFSLLILVMLVAVSLFLTFNRNIYLMCTITCLILGLIV